MDKMKFFCAECGAKFESPYHTAEMQWGQIIISNDDPCPKCGFYCAYTDDADGHAAEMRDFNEYEAKVEAWSEEGDEED